MADIPAQVLSLLGAGLVDARQATLARFALEGVLPQAVAKPETPEQVAALLAKASDAGWGVIPWGSGSAQSCGNQPTSYQVALSLAGLGGVLDHDADNLTLTARAGLTLAEANKALSPKHQRLCLGFPHTPRTLGGLIAENPVSSKRLVYGDIRDQVLGMQVAMPDGSLVRYGRKVIKNVAGYDMNKLFLGSRGLFGVIVEVTCKLFSLPDDEALVLGAFDTEEAALAAGAALFGSTLLPSFIYLCDAEAAGSVYGAYQKSVPPGALYMAAGFEGRRVTLRRQTEDTQKMMEKHGATVVLTEEHLHPAMADALERPPSGLVAGATDETGAKSVDSPLRLRVGVKPANTGAALAALKNIATLGTVDDKGAPIATRPAITVDYGAGQIRMAMDPAQKTAPSTGDVTDPKVNDSLMVMLPALDALRLQLADEDGFLVVESAPAALKSALSPWGGATGEGALMKRFKSSLDPKGILAPGRYLD